MRLELESLSLDQLLQQRQIFNTHFHLTSHLSNEINKALIRKLFVKALNSSSHDKNPHKNITEDFLRHLVGTLLSPGDIGFSVFGF